MIIPDKWTYPTELKLRAWAIDPWNVDVTRCEIGNIVYSSCRMTEGYYADTRMSAEIQVLNPTFPAGSRIRLVAVDAEGGQEEQGTFFISKVKEREVGHDKLVTYELQSTIWAISEDRCGYHWTISANTKASTAIDQVCNYVGKEKVYLPGFNNYTSGTAVTYEIEDSFTSVLFDVCDRSTNRMSVDGHGRLTFGPYVSPQFRQPTWTLDERSTRSVVLSSDLEVEDSSAEAFGRSIVTWKGRVNDDDKEDTEIVSQADVSADHKASSKLRGYTRARVHSESDLSPVSTDRASQLAKQYLTEDSSVPKTFSMTVMWFPCHAGDIVEVIRMDGSKANWIIQTLDADFGSWTKKLTLKEA